MRCWRFPILSIESALWPRGAARAAGAATYQKARNFVRRRNSLTPPPPYSCRWNGILLRYAFLPLARLLTVKVTASWYNRYNSGYTRLPVGIYPVTDWYIPATVAGVSTDGFISIEERVTITCNVISIFRSGFDWGG